MQIVTNNQPVALSEPEGESRLDSLNTEKTSKKMGYAERRDWQHELVWDQEPARMTFAEMPSAEEAALTRLFAQARKKDCIDLQTVPPPMSAAVSQQLDFSPHKPFVFNPPPLVSLPESYANAHELVGLETLAHVPSYEQLLRSASYKIIESHAGCLEEIPVSAGKRFDAGLQTLVDAADRAQWQGRYRASRLPQLRCQAYLSMGSHSGPCAVDLKKLRSVNERSAVPALFCFKSREAKDILSNIWNRVVAKKNASLMLAVMRRKMRIR